MCMKACKVRQQNAIQELLMITSKARLANDNTKFYPLLEVAMELTNLVN